jgi:hypothetical protein
MAVQIDVEKRGEGGTFLVVVTEGSSRSSHEVTLDDGYYRKLTGARITPEELVRRSFEFLLAREPKESILKTFRLVVIARYFPEYEREIARTIGG